MKRFIGKAMILSLLPALLAMIAGTGCGKQPLFDEMTENRLKIIIKGTYESNGPARPWVAGPAGSFPTDADSADDCTTGDCSAALPDPTKFMLDIAEMKLDGYKFANYRKLYTCPVVIGTDDTEPFFNGTGVYFENDDPAPGRTYYEIGMYIRKMIFDNAREYYLSSAGFGGPYTWTFSKDAEVIFHEKTVNGFNFNLIMVNSHFDSLRTEATATNRVFPLQVEIDDGLFFDNKEKETVLEVRLVIKNFVKMYEYDYWSGNQYAQHFWGLSDWLRDVYADETDIGGNLIAVARAYVPEKTATISGSTPGNGWVIAFSSSHALSDYQINLSTHSRPPCEAPKAPHYGISSDLESILDFHLKYEKYKADYNAYVDCTSTSNYTTQYETPWTDYNDDRLNFKIPPLAAWSDGTYSLTNVPLGKNYEIYFVPEAQAPRGSLPDLRSGLTGPYGGGAFLVDGDKTGIGF